jgi:hypothetical protein
MEEWREISEFPNYDVSSLGNIRNKITNKMLRINVKCGYCIISLTNSGKHKSCNVHRLVAIAFIQNPENKPDVNHKDKNKLNNCLSNLEWMTRLENNVHRCLGAIITTNKNKAVFRIDIITNEILETFDSIELAGIWACTNGYTKTSHTGRNSIGNCLNGLSKTAYKFMWKYKNINESLDNEIWKQVIVDKEVVYTDKTYFVSNLGRFKNSSGIIMDNYKVNEYIKVYVYHKSFLLHRLVALAFIPNPENKPQVNHIDGNKLNNSVANLEWNTNLENQKHKFKIGLGNNFTRKITQYDLNMNKIKSFTSIIEASKELNISKSNIMCVLLNNTKTAGGFTFKYIEDLSFYEPIQINKNIGRKVVQYDLDMNILGIHNSMSIAGKNLNIHKNNIWGVINNFRKTAGGFIFKYLEEN